MLPDDLIKTAEDLVASPQGKPRQANLRRAVSTAYYALFHCLARSAADLLIGGQGAKRSKRAWRQVYRALEHGTARENCKNRTVVKEFPKEAEDFANMFVTMQEKRHDADYDPFSMFYKSEVMQDIADTKFSIERFLALDVKDRRAFAAFALFRYRKDRQP